MTQPSSMEFGSFKVAMSHVLPVEHARTLPPLNDATRSVNEDAARNKLGPSRECRVAFDSGVAWGLGSSKKKTRRGSGPRGQKKTRTRQKEKKGPTGIRTQVARIRTLSDNRLHYRTAVFAGDFWENTG